MGAFCCGVVLRLGIVCEGGGCGAGDQGRAVFVLALMRALAGTAGLPCTLHLLEVTCLAWKLLSG